VFVSRSALDRNFRITELPRDSDNIESLRPGFGKTVGGSWDLRQEWWRHPEISRVRSPEKHWGKCRKKQTGRRFWTSACIYKSWVFLLRYPAIQVARSKLRSSSSGFFGLSPEAYYPEILSGIACKGENIVTMFAHRKSEYMHSVTNYSVLNTLSEASE